MLTLWLARYNPDGVWTKESQWISIISIFEQILISIMKKYFSIISFALLVFSTTNVKSQTGTDTILLVNGDEIITNVQDTIKGVITYSGLKVGEKDKEVDIDRVFSTRNTKGETVFYHFDS